jgi:diadenylate cyclase
MWDLLPDAALADLLDVTVVGLLLWGLIAWARRSGANPALLGLALLISLYVAALQLQLELTAWVFRGFFAGLAVLLVVIFQDDLRRLFEQIAALGLRQRRQTPGSAGAAAICRAMAQLAERRVGALVVLSGREPLERHLNGGIQLAAVISEELILSLFDPHCPGHDGAVLVRGDRLERFAVHLPLSADRGQLGAGGTRHAAALGLAERTDALCVVVSEERGCISVTEDGRLRRLDDPAQLVDELQRHLDDPRRRPVAGPGRWLHTRRVLEALAAFSLAAAGWLAIVPGAASDQVVRQVPVVVEDLATGYRLEGITPATVAVTMVGTRRDLLLARADEIQVVVDAVLVELGRRTFSISSAHVRHDTELKIVGVEPEKVRLAIRQIDD